jgi:hypothetical protein
LRIPLRGGTQTEGVSENMLRRIFGQKRDEVAGGRGELHSGKLHDFYSLSSIIRMIRPKGMGWEVHVTRMGRKRKPYRLLVENPERTRPL